MTQERLYMIPVDFWTNVTNWGIVRDLYTESTIAHQAAKSLEELGEYLVNVHENNYECLKDDIGDTIVCLVHCVNFANGWQDNNAPRDTIIGIFNGPRAPTVKGPTLQLVGSLILGGHYATAISCLVHMAEDQGFEIEECLGTAYFDIKDRVGMFVDKFYVKWDNLNPDQRDEVTQRLSDEIILNS